MRHPFDRIPEDRLPPIAVTVAGLSLVLLVVMVEVVERGPGWLAFGELVLSFTPERAARALAPWSVEDRVRIAFVNGLDYLFGPLYANLLALACVWVGRRGGRDASSAASGFAWLAWAVMLLDLPENVAYLRLVGGDTTAPWPLVSGACVLLRTALVLAIAGFVARRLWRRDAARAS